MMDPEAARRKLEEAKADLIAQDSLTEEDRAPVELDQTSVGRLSRMDAIQRQAMAEAGRQRRQLARRRIDAALARVEAGDFGCCARCGEEIDARRLELDPAIATCVACSDAA